MMASQSVTTPGAGESEAMDVDAANDKGKETANKEPPQVVWRIRVCPVAFEDFVGQHQLFQEMIKLTLSVQYRASQHLSTCQAIHVAHLPNKDNEVPWLPNEKVFFKTQNGASAGLVEMKVLNSNLLAVMKKVRSPYMTRKSRMRFEIIRLPPQKRMGPPWHKRDGDTKDAGNKEDGEKGEKEEGEEAENTEDLMKVNFSVRLDSIRNTALEHPPGHVLTPQDKQITLTRVPNDLPDELLSAIMLTQVAERSKGDDGYGVATFTVDSQLGAQGFMELYDGIMVNLQSVDMSTTLGTLREARKIHSDKQQEKRVANLQEMRGIKRKPEDLLAGEGDVKKFRHELDQLNPVSKLYLSNRTLNPPGRRPRVRRRPRGAVGMMGSQRGAGAGGMRRPQLRGRPGGGMSMSGGMTRGRGMGGGMSGGMTRGRGVSGGMARGRGVGARGKPPGRGPPRGAGGAPARRGASWSRGAAVGGMRPPRGQSSQGSQAKWADY